MNRVNVVSVALISLLFAFTMGPMTGFAAGIKEIVVKAGASDRIDCPVDVMSEKPVSPEDLQFLKTSDGMRLSAQVRESETGSVITFILPKLAAGQAVRLVPDKGSPLIKRISVSVGKAGDYQIDIKAGDNLITSYCFPPDSEKPYLYPVIGPNGTRLTRGYPMEDIDFEKELKSQDHPHHRSLWVAYGDVNGGDFWGMGKDPNNRPIQKTDNIAVSESGAVYGRLVADNSWIDAGGKRCVSEQREYIFYNTPEEGRIIDSVVTFTATDGDAHFGDTKEGGICSVRLNPKIDESHGSGEMRNSLGGVGAGECWGKRAEWCDYFGTLDGRTVGVAVFDNPSNLRFPTWWHIRDYGLYSANCFGLHNFLELRDKQDQNIGDYVLPAGESLVFRYRIVLHAGDTDKANIAGGYTDYVTPPEAEIVWEK
ncbi:MAG: PmoA family protein [bacterium]